MRRLLTALLPALALAAAACGPMETQPTRTEPQAAPDWPEGYTGWAKVNDATIVRAEEGVARELYARALVGLGTGTVLVKEQYALVDGIRGPLELVAVMKRTGATEQNGWTFMAFDPRTRERVSTSEAACVSCHTLQAEADYLFTPSAVLEP